MMNEKVSLLLVKGMVSELSTEEQQRILECEVKLQSLMKEYGDLGVLALTMATLKSAIAIDGE